MNMPAPHPVPGPGHGLATPMPTYPGGGDPFGQAVGEERPGRLSPGLALAALKRYGWIILPLWLLGAVGLAYLAHTQVKPTYDARAILSVELTPLTIAERGQNSRRGDYSQAMSRHVALLLSNDVIQQMLDRYPEVRRTRALAGANNPIDTVQDFVKVKVQNPAPLIVIRAETVAPGDGPILANSLAETYVIYANARTSQEDEDRLAMLKKYKEKQEDLIADLEAQVAEDAETQIAEGGGDGSDDWRDRVESALPIYQEMLRQQFEQQLAKEEAETRIQFYKGQLADRSGESVNTEQVREEARRSFEAQPQVARLNQALAEANQKLAQAIRVSRRPGDVAIDRARRSVAEIEGQLDALWANFARNFFAQARTVPGGDAEVEARLNQALLEKTRAERLLAQLDTMMADFKPLVEDDSGSFRDYLLQQKLSYLQTADLKTEQRIFETELQLDSNPGQVELADRARPGTEPSQTKRLLAMAGGPVAWLGFLMVVFVLLELRAERVSDPDQLAAQIQVDVLGVIPPLPSLGAGAAAALPAPAAGARSSRQLQQFMQSLEHLRVLLSVDRASGRFTRRCLLITSACSGEGKTTLAAQLAARCADAGTLTLLIDADLRKPSLTRMLGAEDRPGLVDVLEGRVAAEHATHVVAQGGGFHFLSAGAATDNPIRLLQGEALGELIEQLKAAFDIVLIDAPPILPVPDALLIGRACDGTALSVRHDASRLPLTRRACDKLRSIGIPVLGAILNGCQARDASYYSDYYLLSGSNGASPVDVEVETGAPAAGDPRS